MSSSTREYFWGAELNEKVKEIVWDPDQEDEEDDLDNNGLSHFLFIKQAVLGVKAKENERNIVQIEADDFDGNSITQPLFSLKMGLNESTILDIGLQPPLKLRLVSGSGPVFLSGQHALELSGDDFLLDEDEAEESLLKATDTNQARKRPASTAEAPAKKAKLDISQSKKKQNAKTLNDLDDDEYDSEEDDDFAVGGMGDDDDDDDDDEDKEDKEDSDGEDESEDEGDDEDDDSDMEDDSPEKVPMKKGASAKKNISKVNKVNGTGTEMTAKGKKKGAKGKKEGQSIDQIKKQISGSPMNPKKQMKFLNHVRNTYNISDDKVVNDLWTWYKGTILKN